MKKTMRMLTAALLALMCVPTFPVSAMEQPVYTETAFTDMELVDCGMLFSGIAPLIYVKGDTVNGVTPRENYLRFTLRDGIDKDAAITQVLSVLETKYTGITECYRANGQTIGVRLLTNNSNYFEVEDMTDTAGSVELSEYIMQELAAKGLIDAFYSWGQTAQCVWIQCGFMDKNGKSDPLALGQDTTMEQITAMREYLEDNYSQFEVIERSPDNDPERTAYVRIQTPDDVTFVEKLKLCNELNINIGVCGGAWHLDPAMPQLELGHNALERPGDVTLDCEVDIMDVIAANKYILGAAELCDTAKKNADISGDGTPDSMDSLAILKEVVGLTTDFAEQ